MAVMAQISVAVVQLDEESAAQKQSKWQTMALEAAKQCGQNWLPQVHAPSSPNDFFRELASTGPGDDLRLIGSLQRGAMHLKKILADYAPSHDGGRRARPSSSRPIPCPRSATRSTSSSRTR
jgi:hypothetical protein